MKNIKKILLIPFGLCLAFGLYNCGSSNSKDNSIHDATVYNVSCNQGDYATFSGTTKATSGQEATVSLTSKYDAFEIIGCTFNGEPCTKTSEENGTQNYNYIMPACNVEIEVLYNWKTTDKAGYDNFLSFDSSNVYSTTSAMDDADYNNDKDWGSPLILNYTTNAGWMASANILCFSSNEEIIPNDAISQTNTMENGSNKIIGGEIIVNRSMIKEGTAKIVLKVKSDNNNSYDAIIVAEINITK